jgi:hypothetical protein
VKVCEFCGEVHDYLNPVGESGSWLEGIEIQVCAQIPDGCVYESRHYPFGPSGALHVLSEDALQEGGG